jgi:hypothetical protein
MKWRLRSYDSSPPGAYPFSQGGEKPHRFPAEPMIEAQAHNLRAYRVGNHLPRSSYAECLEDVSTFQCFRLNNDPKYCVECSEDGMSNIALSPDAPGLQPCKGCGAHVEVS